MLDKRINSPLKPPLIKVNLLLSPALYLVSILSITLSHFDEQRTKQEKGQNKNLLNAETLRLILQHEKIKSTEHKNG